MTLTQIDRRLDLYLEYLPYLISWLPLPKMTINMDCLPDTSAEEMIRLLNETGYLIYNHDFAPDALISFDDWLIRNGHDDLAILPDYIRTKSDGFTYLLKRNPLFDN